MLVKGRFVIMILSSLVLDDSCSGLVEPILKIGLDSSFHLCLAEVLYVSFITFFN